LGSPPIQFLGKISYTLYLIHEWIIEWMMQDFYHHFRDYEQMAPEGRERDNFNDDTPDDNPSHATLVLWCFLIFTPLLILISWLLAITVDIPSKDFAYELDIQCRVEAPKPKKGEEPVERPSFGRWLVTSWKFWAIIIFFVVVISFSEIFVAFHGVNPRYRHKHER
jgi:peptidoglycan/LPS O-acetylase OafA/YrhL